MNYINVDVFGKCGNMTCNKEGGVSSEKCYEMIEKKYKFYLSFENSLCQDYVTEKLFQVLQHRIVPVVYGAVNYSLIAPPHSYIDAQKFHGPKQLADYLLFLDSNEAIYNEYFSWKNHYVIEAGRENMILNAFCKLCKKLHYDKTPKVYSKIASHWDNDKYCFPHKTLYNYTKKIDNFVQ